MFDTEECLSVFLVKWVVIMQSFLEPREIWKEFDRSLQYRDLVCQCRGTQLSDSGNLVMLYK